MKVEGRKVEGPRSKVARPSDLPTFDFRPSTFDLPTPWWAGVATSAVIVVTLLWSYWPVLVSLARDWRRDDNYSVGVLVMPAALYLLWLERRALKKCTLRPSWWGLAVLALAELGRWYGLTRLFESGERYAFVLTIVGLVLLVAGWQVFRRTFWILSFLFLMVPLPGKVHNLISGPLQGLATSGAVFTLELLGVVVQREGHVMVLNGDTPVAVAEACSGLRMLTAFVVVSAVLAYVVSRPRWQKTVLVLLSVPVAIACNLLRLTITAELFLYTGSATAERFFHDFAGLVMMPMAFGLLWAGLGIMAWLEQTEPPKQPRSRPAMA